MDCNPKIQLIPICVPVYEWTAIPESNVPQILFSGTKINETPQEGGPTQKNHTNKKKDSVNQKQL